jgi:hypothetical protein
LLFVAFTAILLVTAFTRSVIKKYSVAGPNKTLVTLVILSAIFVASLIPAVVTIRLEQRWLQASMAVFILMLLVAINSTYTKSKVLQMGSLLLFVIPCIAINYSCLNNGANNIYLCNAQNKAMLFRIAMKNRIIKNTCDTLCIYEEKKDTNNENEINWILQKGIFFEYYGQAKKEIIFVDSADKVKNWGNHPVNIEKHQIIYIGDNVIDITDKYIPNYPTYRINSL